MQKILFFASGWSCLSPIPLDRNKILFFMKVNLLCGFIVMLSLSMAWSNTHGQSIYTKKMELGLRGTSLKAALAEIEKQTGMNIFYPTELVDRQEVKTLPAGRRTIAHTLDQLLEGTDLGYSQNGKNIVLFGKSDLNSSSGATQQQSSFRGGIVLGESGLPIAGVTIMMKHWSQINRQYGIQTSTASNSGDQSWQSEPVSNGNEDVDQRNRRCSRNRSFRTSERNVYGSSQIVFARTAAERK
jgi:hypothetical protein